MKIQKPDSESKKYSTLDFSLTVWKKNNYLTKSMLTFLSDRSRFKFTTIYIDRKEASYILKQYRKNARKNVTNLYTL